jgi:hypothetical protein
MRPEYTGLGIHIKVKDIVKTREFYESIGFSPVFGYGDDEFRATLPEGCPSAPERYRGVTYKLSDDIEFEVADGHIAVKPEVFKEEIGSPKVSGMIRVKSLVPIAEKLKDRIKFPVRKYYWGSLEIALRDPDGLVLVFIAPFSEEEEASLSKIVSEIEEISPGG